MQKHIMQSNYLSEFKKYLKDKNVEFTEQEFEECRVPVENILQSYIARTILGDDGFYPIFNQSDETIKKALKVINNYEASGSRAQ